ncbi:MAG: esterase-like activity of phytase family protein [Pseudomonadota bacterium]
MNRKGATSLFGAAIFGVLTAAPLPVNAADLAFDVALKTNSLPAFEIRNASRIRFGKLEFVGGFEISSSHQHAGAFSGLKLIENRTRIIAVTDTGFWFTARVKRDESGRPIDLVDGRMAPMLDESGSTFPRKWESDAESVAISGKSLLVSFERNNRIYRYPLDFKRFDGRPIKVSHPIPGFELRRNQGLETIAVSPKESPLKGSAITITEGSIDKKGNIFGGILSGPLRGVFTVKASDKFKVTDADFLPNGDLILLERRFEFATGLAMRMRRVKAEAIKPGAVLDGEVLLTTDMSFQIDNMEGLAITQNETGETILSLISDDNHSLLQRSLYLEFKLVE